MGTTLHRLSHGRFALGVARGVGIRNEMMMGMEKMTNAHLRDFAELMRNSGAAKASATTVCWASFCYPHMPNWINDDIPLLFVGFGEKSLAFAGSVFDGVVLHTFISDDALARSVKVIRDAAERAGRDPHAVKIWSVLATAHEPDEEKYLRYLVARMATYLQAPQYGELLVSLNGWDSAVIERFRNDETVRTMPGSIDSVATIEQLQYIRTLIPKPWLPAAVGSAAQCAQRFNAKYCRRRRRGDHPREQAAGV